MQIFKFYPVSSCYYYKRVIRCNQFVTIVNIMS